MAHPASEFQISSYMIYLQSRYSLLSGLSGDDHKRLEYEFCSRSKASIAKLCVKLAHKYINCLGRSEGPARKSSYFLGDPPPDPRFLAITNLAELRRLLSERIYHKFVPANRTHEGIRMQCLSRQGHTLLVWPVVQQIMARSIRSAQLCLASFLDLGHTAHVEPANRLPTNPCNDTNAL
jgi:hypothetical protein